MDITEGKGSITVNELIEELKNLPDNVKEAKLHGINEEWLNYIISYTENGRVHKNTSPNDIRVVICNDILFRSQLKGVESYIED